MKEVKTQVNHYSTTGLLWLIVVNTTSNYSMEIIASIFVILFGLLAIIHYLIDYFENK